MIIQEFEHGLIWQSADCHGKAGFSLPIFKLQLFDRDSCTYTYLLADTDTKEAILIDPVIDLAERDAEIIKDLGLKLLYSRKQPLPVLQN